MMMGRILRDIYTDPAIAPLLGFKGGTCAYLFYGLPRFSVDLDFDLLMVSEENKKMVSERVTEILEKYGTIKDSWIKHFTILKMLSYGERDYNIKIEISTREPFSDMRKKYRITDYLGIPVLTARKEYLFAGKLAALTLRKEMTARDIYDIHHFLKENWDIDGGVIKAITGKNTPEHLEKCISFIEKIKDNQILQGLGELIGSEKEKQWIRDHLKDETVFLLRNYISSFGKVE